ncbi:MAG: flagellin [bacterium]|nr:flagellin [bacterium]
MGLRINQNIAGLNAARTLSNTQRALERSNERLSSALRVNRAADDPAGLVISENLRAQIGGLTENIQAAESKLNTFRTAEGRFGEAVNQLRGIRNEALASANTGAGNAVARQAGQTQVASSIESITRTLGEVNGADLGVDTSTVDAAVQSLQGIDVTTAEGANQALAIVDTAISDLTSFQGELGAAQQNTFEADIQNLSVQRENLTASESSIRDADFAEETTNAARNRILQQANIAVLVQANTNAQNALRLLSPGGGRSAGGNNLLAIA